MFGIYILHTIYIFYSYKLFREKSMLYAWIKSEVGRGRGKSCTKSHILGWYLFLTFALFLSLLSGIFHIEHAYSLLYLLIIILFTKTNTHRNRKGIYWHILSIYWAAKGSSNEPRYIANSGMNTLL